MKEQKLKIIVDYCSGYCNVLDEQNNEVYKFRNSANGYKKGELHKIRYNRRFVKRSRYRMMKDIDAIYSSNPNAEYSMSLIKKADPLIYNILKDIDHLKGTSYGIQYLKVMTQMVDKNNYSYFSMKEFKNICKEARRINLEKSGIDISYNLGLFNTSKKISVFDKIKGLHWAINQRKYSNAKVKYSIILKRAKKGQHLSNSRKKISNIEILDRTKSEQEAKKIEQEKVEKVYQAMRKLQGRDKTDDGKSYEALSEQEKVEKVYQAIKQSQQDNRAGFKANNKEVRHLSRKIHRKDESIKNKKYKSLSEKSKKRLIAGVTTVLILGASITGVHAFKNYRESQSVVEYRISQIKKQKLQEFKEKGLDVCKQSIVIGTTPKFGDILLSESFSEKPDGTGTIGYFSDHKNFSISFINVITKDGWVTISSEGKTLSDVLADYPEYITYNIAFEDSETGNGLGFITQNQFEELVQNKIDKIFYSKINEGTDISHETDDISR